MRIFRVYKNRGKPIRNYTLYMRLSFFNVIRKNCLAIPSCKFSCNSILQILGQFRLTIFRAIPSCKFSIIAEKKENYLEIKYSHKNNTRR